MAAPAIGLRRFSPRVGSQIDLLHPLSAGLVMCAVPVGNNFRDITRDLMFIATGATPFANGQSLGNGAAWTAGSANRGWQHPTTDWIPTGEVTVAILLHKDDGTNRDTAAFGTIGGSTGPSRLGGHFPASNGLVAVDIGGFTDSAGGGRTTYTGGTFGNNDLWVVTSAPSSGPTAIWQSGVLRTATTNHGVGISVGGTWYIANGQAASLSTNTPDSATTGLVAVWNRVLPNAQILELSANPYAMLRN
jgi:hypothetical protein